MFQATVRAGAVAQEVANKGSESNALKLCEVSKFSNAFDSDPGFLVGNFPLLIRGDQGFTTGEVAAVHQEYPPATGNLVA